MKTQSIFATLAAAGTAFSAAIDVRQTSQSPISKFTARCTPRTGFCDYSFEMVTGMEQSTVCKGQSEGGDGSLGPVKNTACEDHKFAFAVERPGDNSALLLLKLFVDDAAQKSTGTHPILKAEVLSEQHGAVSAEVYTGPVEFAVAVSPIPV